LSSKESGAQEDLGRLFVGLANGDDMQGKAPETIAWNLIDIFLEELGTIDIEDSP
jgi:hypothetical protein